VDEDRGCSLLQWRRHTAHYALLYMHAQLHTLMMSTLYPTYNWALKPDKFQGHTTVYHHKTELAASLTAK